MKISRGFVKSFLVLFALILVANLIAPIFFGFNVYLVSALMILVIVLFILMYRNSDSLNVKLLKGLVLVIPLVFFGYVAYSNFVQASEVSYFYDIGGVEDFKNPYLYPSDRVSLLKEGASSRNLTSSFAYFDVPAYYSEGNVNISLYINDNFPKNSSLIIGGKNSSTGSYITRLAYFSYMNKTNASLWRKVYADFNVSDLIVENGTFTFYLSAPHLADYRSKNNFVSVDWINITERK